MRRFPRPRLLVSACLEFENVRFNAKVVSCQIVKELMPLADFIKVCPECEIGLGVPRDALRIVNVGGRERLIQPRTGLDFTDQIDEFTERFLATLPPVDGFLFKSGSPTIGFFNIKVYAHPVGAGVVGRTSGIFASKILRQYPGYPIEDDQRVRNRRIKDEFLTRLFAFAGFREAADSGSIDALRSFHEHNRYLFMSYNPDAEILLGSALAQGDKSAYFEGMRKVMSNSRSPVRFADLAHIIFKRYEGQLSPGEITCFHALVDKFLKNKISRDGLLEPLRLFAARMSDREMADQSLYNPYPSELVPDADEDRDRDFGKAASAV